MNLEEENRDLKRRLLRIRDFLVTHIEPVGYSTKMKQLLLYNEEVEELARLTNVDGDRKNE